MIEKLKSIFRLPALPKSDDHIGDLSERVMASREELKQKTQVLSELMQQQNKAENGN